MTFLVLKLVHVAAAILFLGSASSSLVLRSYIPSLGTPELVAGALAGAIWTDKRLLAPSAALLLLSGIALTLAAGYTLLGTGWIIIPCLLFAAFGAIFSAVVKPMKQKLLRRAMDDSKAGSSDVTVYRVALSAWTFYATLAWTLSAAALALMVFKPSW